MQIVNASFLVKIFFFKKNNMEGPIPTENKTAPIEMIWLTKKKVPLPSGPRVLAIIIPEKMETERLIILFTIEKKLFSEIFDIYKKSKKFCFLLLNSFTFPLGKFSSHILFFKIVVISCSLNLYFKCFAGTPPTIE